MKTSLEVFHYRNAEITVRIAGLEIVGRQYAKPHDVFATFHTDVDTSVILSALTANKTLFTSVCSECKKCYGVKVGARSVNAIETSHSYCDTCSGRLLAEVD